MKTLKTFLIFLQAIGILFAGWCAWVLWIVHPATANIFAISVSDLFLNISIAAIPLILSIVGMVIILRDRFNSEKVRNLTYLLALITLAMQIGISILMMAYLHAQCLTHSTMGASNILIEITSGYCLLLLVPAPFIFFAGMQSLGILYVLSIIDLIIWVVSLIILPLSASIDSLRKRRLSS